MSWINWYEFEPAKDTFLCKVHEDLSTKETETGLIISSGTSRVEDRPSSGIVVSTGPDAPYNIGDELFWQKTAGYEIGMIKGEDQYLLLYPDAILGKKVKDTRKNDG